MEGQNWWSEGQPQKPHNFLNTGETPISGYKLLAGAAFGRNKLCPSPAVFHLGGHFLANNTGALAFAQPQVVLQLL